jgi:hypothetical protein
MIDCRNGREENRRQRGDRVVGNLDASVGEANRSDTDVSFGMNVLRNSLQKCIAIYKWLGLKLRLFG